MGVLIDLNNTINEDDEELSYKNSSSNNNNNTNNGKFCMDLWHACAGPLILLPKKGNLVVYLPQGHLDMQHNHHAINNNITINSSNNIINIISNNDNYGIIPPHVFCRVLDVKLHAEDTDEVYAQVSLIPDNQIEEKLRASEINGDGDEDDFEDGVKSTIPHMFCKTLTASDTSTHGGFSVPRRAAEDCFPPLDYNQQRPSQELIAKDLHGVEWKFRHIYRGQPRRHLLTTGWSAFVNKKKLVSGDAVLFLRRADGELRLGVRRAVQLKGSAAFPSLSTGSMSRNGLAVTFESISAGRAFNVCYNLRASSSEFIVPYRRFLKTSNTPFSVGTRFKMRFEADDASERRYTGVITGMAELDPIRWPGSKWKSLTVRWDDLEVNRHGRVSPWEIEPTGSFPSPSHIMTSGLKRNRIGLPLTKPDFPAPCSMGTSDFGESLGLRKVLQGQEKSGFHSACDGNGNPRHFISEPGRYYPSCVPPDDYGIKSRTGFGESFRPLKVLQGQEIHLTPKHEPFPTQVFEGVRVSSYGNGERWVKAASNSDFLTQVPSPSSLLMYQHKMMSMEHMTYPMKGRDEVAPRVRPSCRLFGFSLTEGEHMMDPKRKLSSFRPSIYPATTFWPLIEGQPYYKSPSVSKVVGSNCPGGNNLYAVRDMLLDIAL